MTETYKEYFDYCKDQYQGEFYGELPLEDLTVKKYSKGDPSFKWPEDYQSKIKNIHDYCKLKIEKREGLFDPEHQNIIKVDDYYGCPEVTELGNFFSEYLEKNTYNCYSIVEAVLIYESLPNEYNRSSWMWHYDDNISQQLKLMVYLNDVEEDTGAFEILANSRGDGLAMKSSKIGPSTKTPQAYEGSRIPEEDIERFNGLGYSSYKIAGKAGTFCLFSPNCIHRATVPKKQPHRLCMIYNFRPYHEKEISKVSKSFTKSWSNLGNIKEYDIEASASTSSWGPSGEGWRRVENNNG